jgi:glycosyltransferase involved in cell wall biosynthesis
VIQPPREIFLFFGRLALGGIETMILKVVNQMAEAGLPVIVAGQEAQLSQHLRPEVRRILSISPKSVGRELVSMFGDNPAAVSVTIVSMTPWELLRAALLNRLLSRRGCTVRGFHLVTHSRAFFFDSRMPQLRRLLRWAFFRAPPASTYFMNEAARDAHQEFWKTDLRDYPILRLPIAEPSVSWKPSGGTDFRIVSVGRLVPFKGYNRVAPLVVRALRDGGIPAQWDVWGYGQDEGLIAETIQSAGVDQWVRLRGTLPYERFNETVARYDLFVGMGTALLEAARLGMPAITAVEGTDDQAYGFLNETPLDSVGDKVAGVLTRDLETVIEDAARFSPAEAAAAGQRCRDSAVERSSSVQTMVQAVEQASLWNLDSRDMRRLGAAALLVALRDLRIRLSGRA